MSDWTDKVVTYLLYLMFAALTGFASAVAVAAVFNIPNYAANKAVCYERGGVWVDARVSERDSSYTVACAQPLVPINIEEKSHE